MTRVKTASTGSAPLPAAAECRSQDRFVGAALDKPGDRERPNGNGLAPEDKLIVDNKRCLIPADRSPDSILVFKPDFL